MIIDVNGEKIKFPDNMSREEIKAALDKRYQNQTDYNTTLQAIRGGLQGLTFGFSDELGASIAALTGSLKTGESFSDAYSKIHNQLADKRGAFEKENPGLAIGSEIAGALATGGAGGAKLLANMQNASKLQKLAALSGVGAAEGGIYGAGTSSQDERLEGALSGAGAGALLAPVGSAVVNSAGKVLGGMTNYAADKLTKTPTGQARQVLNDVADAVGLNADEIAERYAKLGPEGALADVDDAFRVTARAGMNRQGTMSQKGKDLAYNRQKGQQERLLKSIEDTSGKANEYNSTLQGIVNRRKVEAGPLYQEALEQGVNMNGAFAKFIEDPLVKSAYRQGSRWASSEGDTSLLNVLHYTKQNIDDQIGEAIRKGSNNKARLLMNKKKELLDEIEKQNPTYIKAMNVFADESALKNALELGRGVLKKDPEELAELMQSMTKGEQELFRLGGVKAVADKFDSMSNTRDATRIMNVPKTRQQIALVLGDDAGAFLKRAGIEEDFSQTRSALTGNSTTAMQQQAGEALDNAIDPGVVEAISSASMGQIIPAVARALGKAKATPEVIDRLGAMMFDQGLTPEQVKRIFQSPKVRKAFGEEYDEIIAPYVQGAIVPAIQAD